MRYKFLAVALTGDKKDWVAFTDTEILYKSESLIGVLNLAGKDGWKVDTTVFLVHSDFTQTSVVLLSKELIDQL